MEVMDSVNFPFEVHDEWWDSAKLWKSQLLKKGGGKDRIAKR